MNFLFVMVATLVSIAGAARADEDFDKLKKEYTKEIASCTNKEGRIYQKQPDSVVPAGTIKVSFYAKSWPAQDLLLALKTSENEFGGVIPVSSSQDGFEYETTYHDGEKVKTQVRKGKSPKIIIDPDVAIEEGGYLVFDCKFSI